MTDYTDKRVVITGGTSGIGLATAKLLDAAGARVLVTGRTPAALATAREVLGPAAIVERNDAVTGVDALAERAEAEFGGVDLLVLNAGGVLAAPVEETTSSAFDELFDLNVKAPFFTVQRFLPLLSSGSAVVFVTSVSNVQGLPSTSVYAATKAALRSLTRTFAGEFVERGIRVNAVSPGPVGTGILERSMPADAARAFLDQMAAGNPMRRLGEPEEIARAIAFLGFDATFATGVELAVDGGVTQL